jgi:hypothetical protein
MFSVFLIFFMHKYFNIANMLTKNKNGVKSVQHEISQWMQARTMNCEIE